MENTSSSNVLFCNGSFTSRMVWKYEIDSRNDLSPYTVQCANVVPPLSSWRQFPLIMVMNKLKGSCTCVGVGVLVVVMMMLAGGVVQSIAHVALFTTIDILSVQQQCNTNVLQIGGLC